ncbi:PAS domain S-box protein [Niveibacterium sp. SC-1]|uniref:PAS domain S-box protein n=1 Tax=Niveibacterium sp. SC-1 TaxID=3135646 RepID=UPI00311EDB55
MRATRVSPPRPLAVALLCAASVGNAAAAGLVSSGSGLPALALALSAASVALLVTWRLRQRQRQTAAALALARNETARFKQLVEGTNAVTWEFDVRTGVCNYASPQAEQLLGFPASSWLQPGFWEEVLHPDDRKFATEFLQAQLAQGYEHELEYRMVHAEGHTVFVRDMRALYRDGEGKVERVRSLLIDLTVHKTTEAALEDSEARFRSSFEQAAVGMSMCSLSGRYLRVNRRYAEVSGYSEAELLEMDFRALTHANDRERNDLALRSLLEDAGETIALEKRLLRADGGMVWVNLTVSVVRSLRREPTQFMEVIEDITQRKRAESVLRESESRLRTIVGSLEEGIVMRDLSGEVIDCNEAAARIFGVSMSTLRRMRLDSADFEYFNADGSRRRAETLPPLRALGSGRAHRDTTALRRPDGQVRWLSIKSEPLQRDSDGSIYAVVTTATDITERRQSEEELRLAATVFENSVEAILVADKDRRVLRVNRAFTEVTGLRADEVLGQSTAILGSGRHDSEFYASIWQAIADNGFWQGEVWNTRKNGKPFPEWLSISAVRDAQGDTTHYVAVFSDITERKANEARIAYLAHHDPLTGLPNRTLLQDRLQIALIRANRERSMVGLLFLDLDRFKTINDSLGHHAGDRLLQSIAERLRKCVRESDTVCRQGGDEFIIVLQDLVDPESPARVAEKILARITEPFEIDGHMIGTSFSIGIAIYPNDGHDADALMKNADTAMYHAKEGGRNTYRFFTEAMTANALERLQLENGLRQALERNELMLHYQPQVSLTDGSVVGAEALIRWHNPQLGFVPPGRFIPIAEESGLIMPIGEWVIREACRQARQWADEGLPPITMAVNLSALQFRRGDIVATVRKALAETGHDPQLLELELTESLLMENAEEVMSAIKRLKSLGIRLSIDDFGTGYSSLAYLKRLEVDRLKIDQSFVRDVPGDLDDAAIVRAVVQLGSSLKLEVIAEGAETAAQVAFLSAEGCREAQGYYYCPPVSPDAFARILRNRTIGPRAADGTEGRLLDLALQP